MINVLFVCTGNICRSPMVEAVFRDLVVQAGLAGQFHIDSAGTVCYFLHSPTHSGTQQILAAHGVQSHSISRRVTRDDLGEADYIVAMDRDHVTELGAMGHGLLLDGRVRLLLAFTEDIFEDEIPDPYYDGSFEHVYQLVEAGCQGLLAHIRSVYGI